MKRRNQESIYFHDDVLIILDTLAKKYPARTRGSFVNAAVRLYWSYAQYGVDGNLNPVDTAAHNVDVSRLSEIARVVNQVMDERERLKKQR